MSKRGLLIGAGVLIAGVIAAMVFMLTRPEETQNFKQDTAEVLLTSNRYAEARNSPTNGLKCLEEGESIDISAEERTDIEYTSMSHVYDVPAGTEVDVKIASYSDNEVTGSNLYQGDYGNYNFVLTKKNGDWAVTEYKRCEI